MKNKETLEEAAERIYPKNIVSDGYDTNFLGRVGLYLGAKWQQERSYSDEDLRDAYLQGWITRERFEDLSPDIIYPDGLDYEEKQYYAFGLWFDKFKNK